MIHLKDFRKKGLAGTFTSIFCIALVIGGLAAAADEEVPSYRKYFSEKESAEVEAFANEHPRLMDAWLELQNLQVMLNEMRGAFGQQKRSKARRLIPRAERAVERAAENYRREYEDAYEEYEEERLELKEKQLRIEERLDWDKSETRAFKAAKAKADTIGEEVKVYEDRIELLKLLQSKIGASAESFSLARIYRIDERTFKRYAEEYQDVLEACNLVKDYHADIAEVKGLIEKDGEDPRLTKALSMLEEGLKEAQLAMEELITEEKSEFDREVERAERDVERLDERIARKEERGSEATREQQEKAPIVERLKSIQEQRKFLDDLAAGTEPAKPESGKRGNKKAKGKEKANR